jgi:hypothetical protein
MVTKLKIKYNPYHIHQKYDFFFLPSHFVGVYLVLGIGLQYKFLERNLAEGPGT